MKFNNLIIITVLSLSLLMSGCARTVTNKAEAGSELRFSISFGDTVDSDNHYYYIIFPNTGDRESIAPVSKGDDAYPYFTAPSNENLDFSVIFDSNINSELREDPINYFYFNYYTNWYDYIEVRNGEIVLYNGPFPTQAPDQIDVDEAKTILLRQNTTSIDFSIPLSSLTHSYEQREEIDFFIISVAGTGEPGTDKYVIADWMDNIEGVINEYGYEYTREEISDSGSYNGDIYQKEYFDSLDIKSWTVNVE